MKFSFSEFQRILVKVSWNFRRINEGRNTILLFFFHIFLCIRLKIFSNVLSKKKILSISGRVASDRNFQGSRKLQELFIKQESPFDREIVVPRVEVQFRDFFFREF